MGRRQREEKAFFPKHKTEQVGVLHRVGQDNHLIEVVPEAVQQKLIVLHLGGDGHFRIQLRNQRDQLHQRGWRAAADRDGALAAVERTHLVHQVLRLFHHPAGLLNGKPAVFVEGDFVLLPVKQGYLQLLLQLLHRAAQGRLREVQLFGGFGDGPALGDGQQLHQLIKFQHRSGLLSFYYAFLL